MDKDANTGLATKLRAHAADTAGNPSAPLIEKIISVRTTIFVLRNKGYSARTMAEWLAREKIHISEGTLRNYIARIFAAERKARKDGIKVPTDADIVTICRDLEREKRTRLNSKEASRPSTRHPFHVNPTPPPSLVSHPLLSATALADKTL